MKTMIAFVAVLIAPVVLAETGAERGRRMYLEEETKVKNECGEDYGKVRLGMDIKRVQHCASYVRKVAETRRAEGTISQYRWLNMLLEVQDGKVTAMTRFDN